MGKQMIELDAENNMKSKEPFEAEVDLTLGLHDLIARGEGDSPAAEEIAKKSEALWKLLTDQERERLNGLAADLYMLIREELPTQLDPNEFDLKDLENEIDKAFARRDYDRLLKLL